MKIAFLTIALLLGSAVNAYEVFYDNADNVTAIGSVEIGGMFYNVDFDTGTYGTFGGNDLFWSESPDAFSAAAAVNAILNSLVRTHC